MVAHTVNFMLDGRADIRECIAGWGSSFTVRQKEHKNSDLPEFEGKGLRIFEDDWGRAYDTLLGWGATPYQLMTVISEESLLGETEYRPYDVAIHEFAHTIVKLCFDHITMRELNALYQAAVDTQLGLGVDMMVDRYEFFAEFSSVYFDAHTSVPRRMLIEELPTLFEFLEDIYGEIITHDADAADFVAYTTQSGIPIPWTALRTRSYEGSKVRIFEDPSFRYSVEIPQGWQLAVQEQDSVAWSFVSNRTIAGRFGISVPEMDPHNFRLPGHAFEEFADGWQLEFEELYVGWDEFVRLSSEKSKMDGVYWLTLDYYGIESPNRCPSNVRIRFGIITHHNFEYLATLYMVLCESETDFEAEWSRLTSSFEVAASDLK